MSPEDKQFYMKIWMAREHKSEISATYLGKEPKSTYFHHILPKKKFPEFRHKEENILLVTFEEHSIIENGVKIYPILKEKYKRLLEEYKEKFGK